MTAVFADSVKANRPAAGLATRRRSDHYDAAKNNLMGDATGKHQRTHATVDRHQMVQTDLASRGEREPRSHLATAGQDQHSSDDHGAQRDRAAGRVPKKLNPPVMESIATRVLTLPARAGHIRQAQRARCRTGRAGMAPALARGRKLAAQGTLSSERGAGAGRAIDTSRPGALGNAARGELCVLHPPNRPEITPTPARTRFPCVRAGVGCTIANPPIQKGAEMSETETFVLVFGNQETDSYMPTPLMAGHAGAWAAARGEYRIAQQLMGLAAALEASELEHKEIDAHRLRNVPFLGGTRKEQPRGYTVRPAAPDDQATAVIDAVSHVARDCTTCGLLIVWMPDSERWAHSAPETAFEVSGEHEPTL